MKKLLLTAFVVLNLEAKHLYPERYYQEAFCNDLGGEIEYELEDFTRVDCLTEEYAIEVDFAEKWAEAVGQSLYYAKMTYRKPAIYLIMEKENDIRFYHRLDEVAKEHGIRIFIDE